MHRRKQPTTVRSIASPPRCAGKIKEGVARTRRYHCCDRKARAACAQSFALQQQARIEITRHDHSVFACSRHIYMGVILRAHPVRGESRIQRNANREVATTLTARSRSRVK